MQPASPLRIRRSLVELQKEYEQGNRKPLADLVRAWQGIKNLKHEDLRSFFALGGYHGEPFRGPGEYSSSYWGGYCNHGNVLFPTWHRVYCFKIEEALQSIENCEEVTLPYWDQTAKYLNEETGEWQLQGVPWALTRPTIELEDGQQVPNPLLSFKLPLAIKDQIQTDADDFTRPQGYETVRYPLSGLVGTEAMRKAAEQHNQQFPDYEQNVHLLNQNILAWLTNTVEIPPVPPATEPTHNLIGIYEEYVKCLHAPNYTVFSNTTSAGQWNETYDPANDPATLVVPLEQPHNDIHLSVGGFDVPNQPQPNDFSPIAGANGDMGENDTAALDPLFYFHHCNVDRMFWLWQKKHGRTDFLEIIKDYPGTNSNDSQFPTPGYAPNTPLDLDSPLNPFHKYTGEVYTSNDCINIETQLGYTYSKGSLEEDAPEAANSLAAASERLLAAPPAKRVLRVTNINRAPIKGSFIVAVYHGEQLVGFKSVLSRWDPVACSNCRTHLEVKAFFPLHEAVAAGATEDDFEVRLIHRAQDTPYLDQFKAYNQGARRQASSLAPAEAALAADPAATRRAAFAGKDSLAASGLATPRPPYRLSIK